MLGIKGLMTGVLTGASATASVLLLVVAYSDRINPADYPRLACLGMAMGAVVLVNLLMLVVLLLFKWQRAWIPLAGLVLSYGSIKTFYPLHGSSKVPEGCIKVITYNVCGYSKPGSKACLDSVADYLRRQKADIACLQEDNISDIEKINTLFPYNDTIHLIHRAGLHNIVGIHSRYPIVKRERIEIPSESNGAVAYYLKIGERTVIVINNHLESFHLTPDDRQRYKSVLSGDMSTDAAEAETRTLLKKVSEAMARRAPQADAVHKYIEEHKGEYAMIVCGDFNDTPISYTRRTIAQGLVDCYVEAGTGAGTSYNQKGFQFRIDHILCTDDFKAHRCVVDDNTKASDHYPVIAYLELDGFFNRRR